MAAARSPRRMQESCTGDARAGLTRPSAFRGNTLSGSAFSFSSYERASAAASALPSMTMGVTPSHSSRKSAEALACVARVASSIETHL